MAKENTPPASPGIPDRGDDDEMFDEGDIAEEIEVGEGAPEVSLNPNRLLECSNLQCRETLRRRMRTILWSCPEVSISWRP